MAILLPPDIEASIHQKIEGGRFPDAAEVVREALRLLDDDERRQHLRSLLAVGLEQERQGDLVDFTPELEEEIDRRAEERFRRGDLPNPDVCP